MTNPFSKYECPMKYYRVYVDIYILNMVLIQIFIISCYLSFAAIILNDQQQKNKKEMKSNLYLQNSTKTNSLSLMTVWKLACVNTKTPFSTSIFDSASHCTKPDKANIHAVTAKNNIFPRFFLFTCMCVCMSGIGVKYNIKQPTIQIKSTEQTKRNKKKERKI